jgi:pilus assembly protein CpaD
LAIEEMTMKKHTLLIVLAGSVALASCAGSKAPLNRSVDAARIPTIAVDNVSHDVHFQGERLAAGEEADLLAFLRSVGPGFADRISVEDPNPENAQGRIGNLSTTLGRLGVSVASVKRAADLAPGYARVVVSKAVVISDQCPDWNNEEKVLFNNASSTNYGCASRSNLARMVADPSDLVAGRKLAGQDTAATAKPVAIYDSHKPEGFSGSGGDNWAGDGPKPQ